MSASYEDVLQSTLDERIAELTQRLYAVEQHLDRTEKRYEAAEARIHRVDDEIVKANARMDQSDTSFLHERRASTIFSALNLITLAAMAAFVWYLPSLAQRGTGYIPNSPLPTGVIFDFPSDTDARPSSPSPPDLGARQ